MDGQMETKMKTGKTLSQLAAEIERQSTTRKDYVAPTEKLVMAPAATDMVISGLNGDAYGLTETGHRQVGEHVGIPAKYYDRMRTAAPELLAQNVNTWFHTEPSPRMVRTLDGKVRAFLSDKYRPLENHDLAEAVLPVLIEQKLEIVSCEITERRMYIKAVDGRVVRQINSNRIVDGSMAAFEDVCPSLVISNSEVGMGALSVEVGMFQHRCKNMAIFRERSMRKYHVGGKHELADGLVALLSEKTRRLSDAATWAQVGDVVRNALNPVAFETILLEVNGMQQQKITGDVVRVVDLAARQFGTTEGEKASILKHLIEGGDLSRFGMFNAITRTAEDIESYDRATEFERIGGQVIELAANDWRRIAEAA